MRTIYLVTGTTGEYADWSKWNVKAFDTMDMAINFMEEIHTVIQDTLEGAGQEHIDHATRTRLEKALKDLDPNVSIDYTGVDYEIEEIELEEYE